MSTQTYKQFTARMKKIKAIIKAAPAPMTSEQLLAALGDLHNSLTERHDELQTKMRELGSAAAEVNQLRIQVTDLINKAKAQ